MKERNHKRSTFSGKIESVFARSIPDASVKDDASRVTSGTPPAFEIIAPVRAQVY